MAQPLATFCSSLGYLFFGSQRSSLIGFLYQKLSNFSKSDICLVFIYVTLASFALENYFCHHTLGYGLLILPIVLPWATFGYLLSYDRCSPRVAQDLATCCSSLGYLLFGCQRSSLMGFPDKKLPKFFKI